MKKKLTVIAVALLALTIVCAAAFADGPEIKRIKYIGNGKVVVLFAEAVVRTKNQSIIVRDSRGNKLPAHIVKTTGKEVTLRVPNVRKDEQYTFELGGVNVGKNRNLRYSNYFFARDNWRKDRPELNACGPQQGRPGQNAKPGQPPKHQNGHPRQQQKPAPNQNGQWQPQQGGPERPLKPEEKK